MNKYEYQNQYLYNLFIQLSDEERPNMHKVLPLRQLLLNHCEVKVDDSDRLKQLTVFLGRRIESIWILQDQHYMCTLLHPSLKHFHIAPNEHNKALELVKQELLKRTPALTLVSTTVLKAVTSTASVISDTTACITSKNLLTCCFDQKQSLIKPVPTPVNELDNYMALDIQIHDNDDILFFWKENEK